jgi:hypothetical protein
MKAVATLTGHENRRVSLHGIMIYCLEKAFFTRLPHSRLKEHAFPLGNITLVWATNLTQTHFSSTHSHHLKGHHYLPAFFVAF